MGCHIGCNFVKDGGDLDHLGMVSAMDSGDLVGVGGYLPGFLLWGVRGLLFIQGSDRRSRRW